MKKKMFSKTLGWMRDAGLKAFVVLALVVGGFYAYAAISWPGEPNATTGVVGMFVGESKTAFTASSTYQNVNVFCNPLLPTPGITDPDGNTVTGAHVCTPDEVVNSYNHGTAGSPVFDYYAGTIATQVLWVNNGPPGYTANANDCAGWSDVTSNSYGTAWDFRFKKGFLRSCGEPSKLKFACCK